MNLRKLAEGQSCMVRLPGICLRTTETVVLAHVRLSGITGVGMKAPDVLGTWCCAACHAYTEQNKADDAAQRAFYEGVMRTQYQLILEDVLKW